ncbi:hypothetical protein D3C73_1305430 [compost metagenome]
MTAPLSATVVEPWVGARSTVACAKTARAVVSRTSRTRASPAAWRLPELMLDQSTARWTMASPWAATWSSTAWSWGSIRMARP